MRGLFIVLFIVQASVVQAQMPDDFAFSTTNSSGTLLGQVQISGVYADDDDWIAAFDESGICCGASQITVFNGVSYINLVIYGDDATTAGIDEGINGGESFSLKLFDASTNSTIDYELDGEVILLENWSNTNGAPMPNYSNTDYIYQFYPSQVSFNQSISVCENEDEVVLNGGFPEGGTYSGTGVIGSIFYPSVAGAGAHEIVYSLNNQQLSINALVHAVVEPEIINDGPFCTNDEDISLESSIEGGTFSGQGVINHFFSPNLLTAGTYPITYDVVDSNQCALSSQTLFEVFQAPEVNIIVDNDLLSSNVIIGNPTDFLWSTNETSSEITVMESGNYWLMASDVNCHSDTILVEVEVSHSNMFEPLYSDFYFYVVNKTLFVQASKDSFQGTLQVLSLDGKRIERFELNSASVIDMSFLTNGIYVLHFTNNHYRRIVVVKL